MIQIPKDLFAHSLNIKLTFTDMQGVIIDGCNAYQSSDVLQTSHCLEIVLIGSVKVIQGGFMQDLVAGDIQFRKRGRYHLFPTGDYSSLLIFLENGFLNNFLQEHIVETNLNRVIFDHRASFLFKTTDFINANIIEAIKNIKIQKPFSMCIFKFSVHNILLQILALDESKSFASFLQYLTINQKIEIRYFMEANFTHNMELKDLAKMTGRSMSSFKKEFFETFNTTPIKWVINRRLELAEYLITNTPEQISLIAYKCGFENISHFSKIYRQKFGVSPGKKRHLLLMESA